MQLYYQILILFALIAIDLYTKIFATNYLQDQNISLIGDILTLRYAENTGIAFGLAIEGLFLQILTVVLIIGIISYYFYSERAKKSLLLDTSFTLIIAGAIGNAYERIFQGYVVDFIALKYFAVCNFADICISVGGALLLAYYISNDLLGQHSDQKK